MEQQKINAVLISGDLNTYNQERYNLIKKGDFERLQELTKEYENDNTKRDIERVRVLLKRRRNRVAKRINDMIFKYQNNAYFITLTFRDSVFTQTTKETRRDYVANYLNDHCGNYVANIDFGDDHVYFDDNGELRQATSREHYHAVVNKKIDLSKWFKDFGAFNCEKITIKDNGVQKMSEYIMKLTNHALKMSALTEKPIFSRGGGKEAPRSLWATKEQIHNDYISLQNRLAAKITTNKACPFRCAIEAKATVDWQRFIKEEQTKLKNK